MGHADALKEQGKALKDHGAKALKDQVDSLGDRLPDSDELASLRDSVVAKIAESIPDEVTAKLPDSVVDKLPVEKKSGFATVRTVIGFSVLAAVVGAVVAYVRAQLADDSNVPQYTPPSSTSPTGTGPTA